MSNYQTKAYRDSMVSKPVVYIPKDCERCTAWQLTATEAMDISESAIMRASVWRLVFFLSWSGFLTGLAIGTAIKWWL